MSAIVEWRGAEVVAFFINVVAARMATAAKFVEEEARANLAAIDDPAWGAGYRNEIVGRLLISVVETKGKEVLGKVGVRTAGGSGGDHHGFYIETGSSTAPAHPWLRPALFENGADVLKLLEG